MRITNATGDETGAKVDAHNRLTTFATVVTQEHYVNDQFGEAYNLLFDVTPASADARFVYILNNSRKTLIVEGFTIWCASNEILTFSLDGTGTATGGDLVTPVNLNANSKNTAEGTFYTGSEITGISGGKLTYKFHVEGAGSSKHFNFNADLLMPRNSSLCMHATNGSIALDGHILFYHSDSN